VVLSELNKHLFQFATAIVVFGVVLIHGKDLSHGAVRNNGTFVDDSDVFAQLLSFL
jgi:hypothetical protein